MATSGRYSDSFGKHFRRFLDHIGRVEARGQAPIEAGGHHPAKPVPMPCQELLPDDAILTNGAGNYSGWVHRFYQHRKYRTQLAPTSGAMGYGVPSAVAAAITYPARTVVCFMTAGPRP